MKYLFTIIILSICFHSSAALKPGFDKEEAKALIAICNSFTFLDLYGSDKEIIPAGYTKKYTSGTFGLDNKFQVYVHGNTAVVNFRGSTENQMSWIENFYASMIPASGTMKVDGKKFEYCFAGDTAAAVHSGYALGIAFLHMELLSQLKNLNRAGIYDILLTGHSQGGALANLFRAFAENQSGSILSNKNNFKTYVFAAPMTGNKEFALEYNSRFGSNGTSFSLVNLSDPIPTFPLSYNDTNFVQDQMNSLLFGKEPYSLKKLFIEGGAHLFDGKISRLMTYVGNSADKKIDKKVAPVELPAAVKGINYYKLGERIELAEFSYPKILKDSTILQNDSLILIYERDKDGNFKDENLYVKSPWSFQHKPYNYYVGFLKMYFPEEYRSLNRKYLIENL